MRDYNYDDDSDGYDGDDDDNDDDLNLPTTSFFIRVPRTNRSCSFIMIILITNCCDFLFFCDRYI